MSLSKRIILISIFLIPFIIRAGYFLETKSDPYLNEPILISYVHHQFAVDLMDNNQAPYTIFRSPFYPLLISKIYNILAPNPLYIKTIQWILGALGCILLFFISRQFLSFRKAIAVFLIYALYIPSIYFEGELFEHSVTIFFILLSFYTIVLSLKKHQTFFVLCLLICLSGFFYGISFLIRPDTLLSFPFLIISFMFYPFSIKRKLLFISLFSSIILIFFYIQANPQLLIPVEENRMSLNASANFYLGNNPKADGFNPKFDKAQEMPSNHPEAVKYHITGLTLSTVLYAKTQTSGKLSDIAPYWFNQSKHFILNDFSRYLLLLGRKFITFFNGFLITNQKDIYYLRNFSAILYLGLWTFLICFPLGLILPFALTSICFQKNKLKNSLAEKMLLLSIPSGCLLNTLIFFNSARFNQASIPFFIIFSVEGFCFLYGQIRQKKWGYSLIFSVLLVLCNFNFFNSHYIRNAQESFNAGTMYSKKGELKKAEQFFRKSVEYDNDFSPALLSLNSIFKQFNRQNEGLQFYLDLYEKNKDSWAAAYCIADLYSQTNNLTKALTWAKRLIKDHPDNAENYMLLGNIYLLRREPLEAVSVYKQGADKFPDYSLIQLSYVSVLVSNQRYNEALKVIEQILTKTTHYPETFYYAGYCFIARKKYEDAYAILNEGIKRHPTNFSLLSLLAHLFEKTSQIDKAVICHDRILKTDPSNNISLYETARLLHIRGNDQKALLFATRAYKAGNQKALELIHKIKK